MSEKNVHRSVISIKCLICFLLLFAPYLVSAEEWINVLDPSQTISSDQISPSDGFKMIPDLNVVSVFDTAQKKTINVKYEIHSILKEAVQKEGKIYDTLFVPGCGYHFDTGQPDIPAKSIFIEIPENSQYSVDVVKTVTTQLQNIDFFPAQPLPQDNMAFEKIDFEKDSAVYNDDSFFPENNIISTREFRVRGHRMLEIIVSPIQYNPVSKEVKMAPSLDVRIQMDGQEKNRSSATQLPASEYTDVFSGGLRDFSDTRENISAPAKNKSLEKYMILMHEQFSDNPTLKEFILWKKKKGYSVTAVTTSSINANAGSNDTFNNCVGFMRGLPKNEYPNYLLIIGDHRKDKGIQSKYIKTYMGGYSDLTIACRDDVDYLPDLYHGRLPASNNEELTVMLKKILAMDQHPPTQGMYDKILVAGQIQDTQGGKDGRADRLFFETGDALASYFENNKNVKYDCTSVFENPHGMKSSGFWNKRGFLWAGDIIGKRPMKRFFSSAQSVPLLTDKINKGLALIQYRAHGEPKGWGNPRWTSSHVQGLTNGANQPVVFSVTCLTGAYHKEDNFSKMLLAHPSGGSYGVISAVDVSFSWTNDMFVHGLYAAFLDDYIASQRESTTPKWTKKLSRPSLFVEGSANRLGVILNSGLLYLYEHFNMKLTKATFELFHLFGDPESFIRFHKPTTFSQPAYPKMILSNKKNTIKIGGVEKGTLVCLYSDNEKTNVHQAKIADSDTINFDVLPKDKGLIFVTATKYGKIPYQGKIKVESAPVAPSNVEDDFINEIDPDSPGSKTPLNSNDDESEFKSVL